MFKSLSNWIDDRTGYKSVVQAALDEPIPGRARWRYVVGSSLLACFMIQMFTGVLLMFNYSPSAESAWASVYYITTQVDLGWFVRGLHRFAAYAMVILVVLHLMQTVVTGAYHSPREFTWWFGMSLMLLTFGLGITGNILPWDQHGYWAAVVETVIAGSTPIVGPIIQRLAVGGPNPGNLTLTRMYALHVAVLPALMVICLTGHLALIRRNGLTPVKNAEGMETGWPKQVMYRLVAIGMVLGVVVYFTLLYHGAPLEAPADHNSEGYPARPEWYFLWLYESLKLFHGGNELIATVIVPSTLLLIMFLVPLFDRVFPRKLAHFLACSFVFGSVGGASYLTFRAMNADAHDPLFIKGREASDAAAARAFELASLGVPPEGSSYVLGRDPLYHGGMVFTKKCASCHYFGGKGLENTPQTAADLEGFGTKPWIRGLLENPRSDKYFGKLPQLDGMARWKKATKLTPKQLDDVADFVAGFAEIPDDMGPDEWLEQPRVAEHKGLEPFVNDCGKCHKVPGLTDGGDEAPDLFGWGSTRWTSRVIRNPGGHGLYKYLGEKQVMPAFAGQTTPNDVTTVIRYLKGDYHRPGDVAKVVETSASPSSKPASK